MNQEVWESSPETTNVQRQKEKSWTDTKKEKPERYEENQKHNVSQNPSEESL